MTADEIREVTAFAVPGAILAFGLFLSFRTRRRRPRPAAGPQVATANG